MFFRETTKQVKMVRKRHQRMTSPSNGPAPVPLPLIMVQNMPPRRKKLVRISPSRKLRPLRPSHHLRSSCLLPTVMRNRQRNGRIHPLTNKTITSSPPLPTTSSLLSPLFSPIQSTHPPAHKVTIQTQPAASTNHQNPSPFPHPPPTPQRYRNKENKPPRRFQIGLNTQPASHNSIRFTVQPSNRKKYIYMLTDMKYGLNIFSSSLTPAARVRRGREVMLVRQATEIVTECWLV